LKLKVPEKPQSLRVSQASKRQDVLAYFWYYDNRFVTIQIFSRTILLIVEVQPHAAHSFYPAMGRIAWLWLTCWTTDIVVSSVMQVTSFPWVYHAW
jgi:hypothetical protein